MENTLKIMTKRNNSNMYMTKGHLITIHQGKMQGGMGHLMTNTWVNNYTHHK